MLVLLILATFAVATTAQDVNANADDEELEAALKKWIRDYVRYIITDKEKGEWKNLADNKAKVAFIEMFWARRDPTPETPENEYRDDYLQRWGYVLENFSAGKPGWRTDRGRIYLMLGPPSSIQRNPMGRDATERPSEVWTYNSINNSKLPASVDVSFVDFMGYGDYEIVTDLDRTARFNSAFGISMNNLDAYGLRRIGDLRDYEDVISPMWEESRIMQPATLSSQLFDLQQELALIAETPKLSVRSLQAEIRTEIATGDLSFNADAQAFKAEGGSAFLPVTLSIPLSNVSYQESETRRDYQVELYARVHGDNASDSLEDSLQISLPNETLAEQGDADYVYQFWFYVPPGDYRLSVTLRDKLSGTVGNHQQELSVPEFAGESLSLSDVMIADSITRVPANEITQRNAAAAFRFADLRVVPNVGKRIPIGRKSFFVYFHVYNFASDPESGDARLSVRYFVYRNGELMSKTPDFPIRKRYADTTAVQSEFPLSNFQPGDYRLLAEVTDEVSGSVAKGECAFSIITKSTIPDAGK